MKKKLLRYCLLATGLAALYLGINLALLYGGSLRAQKLQAPKNAAWMAHRFFDDRDRKAVSDLEVEQLAERCRRHDLEFLFVHVGPLDARGKIPPYQVERWRRVADRIPHTKWLAWVGGLNADFEGQAVDTVDLTRPEVRAGIAETVRELYRAGFAGVHYDIEPIRDGDKGFLALLDETPKDGLLSVATPHMRPPGAIPVTPFERMWTPGYYREVGARCQQVVYMGYDSGQPSQETYARWMRWQCNQLKACLKTQLLIGVPTYDEERTLWHDPAAETLAAALWGIGASGPVDGVAIYADWTSSDSDWETLASFRDLRPIRD